MLNMDGFDLVNVIIVPILLDSQCVLYPSTENIYLNISVCLPQDGSVYQFNLTSSPFTLLYSSAE